MAVLVGTGRQPDADLGIAAKLAASGARPTGDEAEPKPNCIGIVFVHGIGSQKPGETIMSWARPLLSLINAWAATTRGVPPLNDPVTSSNVDFTGSSRPFVVANVPAHGESHPEQTWIMTEAWWATHVSPPSVGTMFSWLFPREMRRLVGGIVSGIAGESGRFVVLLERVFLRLLIWPMIPLVFVVYLLFRLLRAIPFKPIQEFAVLAGIEFFLVDWFGDVRILLTDRAQAANIRARVAEGIKDLIKAGCGTIVVIGHSGGTIVAYMTLADPEYGNLRVKRFITHGQALGIAWRLGHIEEYTVPDRRVDRLYRGDRLKSDLSSLEFRSALQWHDFWATHDPAPAGGFTRGPAVTIPEQTGGITNRVFNRMSVRNDHGDYWNNTEEFVLPVARLIELAPDGAPAQSRFFPDGPTTARVERRQERVKLMQFAWLAVMISAVVAVPLAYFDPRVSGDKGSIETAGIAAWDGVGQVVRLFEPLMQIFGLTFQIQRIDGNLAVGVGIIVLIAAYWAVGHAMASLWTAWDARERQIALQPIPQWRSLRSLTIQLALCAAAAVWLLTFAASGSFVLASGSLAAVALAYLARAVSDKGVVRRPGAAELEQAGVA